jgi:glycosyltransferase involved in cell wall biosynthesis
MKILFFIESLRSGGKERRLVELIKGLRCHYSDVEIELVLTRQDVHYTEIFDTGIKIHYVVRKGLKKDPRIFFQFYKIVKKIKPDIINVWGNMVAIYAIPSKVLFGIPMINNQITNAPLKVSKGIFSHQLSFIFSDKIISNSYAGLKAYNSPKEKSSVIYNGFDFNRISNLKVKEEVRKIFQIETTYVVGMIASFSSNKDYTSFLNAALLILEKRRDVTFLCVGSGDYSVYNSIVPSKLNNKIKFLGKQNNVESIMNVCDIGVLSTYTEGISNSLLEFMALGKPVIATDGGGTKELVVNHNCGYLITVKSPELLCQKIEVLLENNDEREFFGLNCKKRIKKNFNIEKMVSSFYSIYNEISFKEKTLIK